MSETRSEMVVAALRRLFSRNEAAMLTKDFVCSSLRPSRLNERGYHGGLRVLRPGLQVETEKRTDYRGWEGFAAVRADLLGEDHSAVASRMSIKVVSVEELDSGFSAEVMVKLRRGKSSDDTPWQVTTSWHTQWTKGDPPRLMLLRRKYYEESRGDLEKGFVDAGVAVLGGVPHYRKQILRGVGDWAARVTRLGDFSLTGHHGLAVGDVNGDGLEDLYVCDGGSLPNRLYLQQEDGTVVDGSAEAGVDWLEDSRSALLIDLDNDGDEDLVVATIAMVIFLENDGTGKFSLRGGHPGASYPFSLSAADFDTDGLLDIHVCVYSAGDDVERRGFEVNAPSPFHDAENGGRNILLKNLGDFGFADATAAVGLDADNTRWSFAAAWEDYDRDGDPDLYVANDFGRNCLYRNEGGRFRQIADELKVEDMASGMSVAWGDYNRDGWSDIYVGNMFSAAGNRVSRQKLFTAGSDPDLVGKLRRMARGNSLFAGGRGEQGHGFRDVSEGSRSHLGQWAWSSGFGDLNNDG
ncbi:MAG: VCBS repeat-containing protein, partial [Verrucomicrobiota bacterium]|nr:VCBS repeat-containing protein [Verrucomicrobiota bacterium]